MKLYTEEEVIRAIELSDGRSTDEVLAGITPIELPSDEEIDMKFGKRITMYDLGYTDGAKWIRDKITKSK